MPKSSHERRITGAASIIGAATVLSRILGYARDAVVAYVFGAGLFADAFFMAFRIANLLRRLVGEGALTSSFIPIFTDELNRRGREGTRTLVSSVLTLFTLILIGLTVLGIIFSKEIVYLMSPGFSADPVKFEATVNLTKLMFPYMVFIGLMAISMGVLNSLRHFTAPALAPVFLNIAMIGSVFLLAPLLDVPIYSLAWGVLLGGLLQFLIQVPYLRRNGYTIAPAFNFRDPAIKRIFVLMGPAAFGVGVYQLNIFVTNWFASHLPEGSVAYLYYAGRLMELPLGVFGVAIYTAVLPSLSEHVTKKDWEGMKGSLSFALRIVNFVNIPATVGLFVLSYPIIDMLFMRGEFTSTDTAGTAVALYYYTIGLVPVAVARILTSVFYSLKDTSTPVWGALASFIANVILCFLLVGPMGHAGLALATSLSAAINCGILFLVLRWRFGHFRGREVWDSALRSGVASLIMGIVVFGFVRLTGFEGLNGAYKAVVLGACVAIGFITYVTAAKALRAPEIAFLKGFLNRKRGS